MPTTHIIVTGSRNWEDSETITKALDELLSQGLRYVSVGDCKTGADRIAHQWCVRAGLPPLVFVADWERFGKAAVAVRNQQMVDAGGQLCLGFVESRSMGTLDCLNRASKKGIKCVAYLEPERRRITWDYPGLPRKVSLKRTR